MSGPIKFAVKVRCVVEFVIPGEALQLAEIVQEDEVELEEAKEEESDH